MKGREGKGGGVGVGVGVTGKDRPVLVPPRDCLPHSAFNAGSLKRLCRLVDRGIDKIN